MEAWELLGPFSVFQRSQESNLIVRQQKMHFNMLVLIIRVNGGIGLIAKLVPPWLIGVTEQVESELV